MKNLIVMVLMLFISHTYAQSKTDTWTEFAKTKFNSKFNEKLNEYFFSPTFTPTLKSLEGKEVTLQGFYVPFSSEDGEYIVISRVPMSQCFFCGGSGPESIAEVYLSKSQGRFEVDDIIKVKGKLKLNSSDPEHVNFLITQAELEKE